MSPESMGGRLGPQCSAGAGDALRERAEQKVLGHGEPQWQDAQALLPAPSPFCTVVG